MNFDKFTREEIYEYIVTRSTYDTRLDAQSITMYIILLSVALNVDLSVNYIYKIVDEIVDEIRSKH